jgi:hypothetical protein
MNMNTVRGATLRYIRMYICVSSHLHTAAHSPLFSSFVEHRLYAFLIVAYYNIQTLAQWNFILYVFSLWFTSSFETRI